MRGADRILACLGVGLAFGCATTQTVSLECVPREVEVFVDGRELEGRPDELSLRADEPHTFFFKGGGFETQMVVLEPKEVDGVASLAPAEVCSEVSFIEMQPDVQVEIDTDPGS